MIIDHDRSLVDRKPNIPEIPDYGFRGPLAEGKLNLKDLPSGRHLQL